MPIGVRSHLVQRKCACGKETYSHGECEGCKRRREASEGNIFSSSKQTGAPPIVHEVLRSPGQPLDAATRAFLEPRFGHDFGKVRVHTDAQAAESARAVNALAYTVGQSIVFGAGQFRPASSEGQHLIAHELAHTIQQPAVSGSDLRIQDDSSAETEAQNAALVVNSPFSTGSHPKQLTSRTSRAIQRKVVVKNPSASPTHAPSGETNEKIVKDYVTTLCPSFTVTAGELMPFNTAFCPADRPDHSGPSGLLLSSTPESCSCLCTMHALVDPASSTPITWQIEVDDNDWPQTDSASKTVKVQSPFSGVQVGAWSKGPSSHRITQTGWRALGHELCGHGALFATGRHPTGPPPRAGGRPEHDPTVAIENRIAAEHGLPPTEMRGLFADPHHGESFGKITVEGFPKLSPSIGPAQKQQIDRAAEFVKSSNSKLAAHIKNANKTLKKFTDNAKLEAYIKSVQLKLDVIGHADQGPDDAVASSRANNVKTELISRGIDAQNFVAVKGVGSSECTLPGDQPSCRKVDIFMFRQEGASVDRP